MCACCGVLCGVILTLSLSLPLSDEQSRKRILGEIEAQLTEAIEDSGRLKALTDTASATAAVAKEGIYRVYKTLQRGAFSTTTGVRKEGYDTLINLLNHALINLLRVRNTHKQDGKRRRSRSIIHHSNNHSFVLLTVYSVYKYSVQLVHNISAGATHMCTH